MSSCASNWEGHGFSGAFSSTRKPLQQNFDTIEAPSVPDDVFEELCWEDGQLRLHQRQRGSWAGHASAKFEATRDGSADRLDEQGNAASIQNNANIMEDESSLRNRVRSYSPHFFDDEMMAWLQYPPDVELHTDNTNSAVSYLPPLPLDNSHGALYRDYVLLGAIDRKRQYMRTSQGTGPPACRQTAVCLERHALSHATTFPSPKLDKTADLATGSASDMQAPEELGSTFTAVSLPPLDPRSDKNVQSTARLAADASLESLGLVKDRTNMICSQNGGGMSGNSSLESSVTGISTHEPSGLADPDCYKAASVAFQQVQGVVLTPCRPDAEACTDAASHSKSSNTHIKEFSESRKRSKHGDHAAKSKGKGSKDSQIQPEAVSLKRSRTALHNKSEKMRRERINSKLKTLQELIPNANQTDRASLLGQTIEYLQALQVHLLVISYRTGLAIPPRLISQSMRSHPFAPPHAVEGFGAGFAKDKKVKSMRVDAPARSSMRKLRPLVPLPGPRPLPLRGLMWKPGMLFPRM